MNEFKLNIDGYEIYEFNSVIIGSGAAGLNCALHLVMEGIHPEKIAIVTDNLGGGTSFNTGSDKQTYYKMSIIGDQLDSPYEMANDLCKSGAMHGDIALIEATNSIREFFHLVELGVRFPHDEYGSFVGYKTDNDPRQRATSVGPLTSRVMGECLLKEVQKQKIKIFDKFYAISILLNNTKKEREAIGLICLKIDELESKKDLKNVKNSIRVFKATNIIMATGGPAKLYKYSVYPESQEGSMGLAITAGCKLQNLTESQFGLASIEFRWNLSGSYQQVIPRYFSIDPNENKEIEFLNNYFPSFLQLSKAIFLKGYQWPFNVERVEDYGSSLIDLAVYYESIIKERKIFLDFTKNPSGYNENELYSLAKDYLSNSHALEETPIKRLDKLNPDSISLYKSNGIDITNRPLQIAICNQHLNGGVTGDKWWETTIKHLFAIGEVNGSHGIHRPGGAALNSGQVGGLRTAQKIAHFYSEKTNVSLEIFKSILKSHLESILTNFNSVLSNDVKPGSKRIDPGIFLEEIKNRMEKFGGITRPLQGLYEEGKKVIKDLYNLKSLIRVQSNQQLLDYLQVKDALLTQQYILGSILNYHISYGKSRGSFLILRDKLNPIYNERYIVPPNDLNELKFITSDIKLQDKIQTINSFQGILKFDWEPIREIPKSLGWFENVWKQFKNDKIYD